MVQVFRIPGIFLMPATLMIPIFERSNLSFSMENPFWVYVNESYLVCDLNLGYPAFSSFAFARLKNPSNALERRSLTSCSTWE